MAAKEKEVITPRTGAQSKLALHGHDGGMTKRARRLWNIAILAGIVVTLFGLTLTSGSSYDWDFGVIKDYFPALAESTWYTLWLTAVVICTSALCGVVTAAARLSSIEALRWVTATYIEIMRATPLLVQIVWVFYALPVAFGISLGRTESAILALTLHGAAYYGEAFRAGIQSVPVAHKEAAVVLGLTTWQQLRLVILPEAIRNVLPVLVTQSLMMLKDTSLVSVIGLTELMFTGESIALLTYRPLEILTVVGIIYLIIGAPFSAAVRALEVRLSRRIV